MRTPAPILHASVHACAPSRADVLFSPRASAQNVHTHRCTRARARLPCLHVIFINLFKLITEKQVINTAESCCMLHIALVMVLKRKRPHYFVEHLGTSAAARRVRYLCVCASRCYAMLCNPTLRSPALAPRHAYMITILYLCSMKL